MSKSVIKYVKNPVMVEAIQFNGNSNKQDIEKFVGRELKSELESETAYVAGKGAPIFSILIETKEGVMKAFKGDWIIKEPFPTGDRDFYPCKNDIFTQTYQPASTAKEASVIGVEELKSDFIKEFASDGENMGMNFYMGCHLKDVWEFFEPSLSPQSKPQEFDKRFNEIIRFIQTRLNTEFKPVHKHQLYEQLTKLSFDCNLTNTEVDKSDAVEFAEWCNDNQYRFNKTVREWQNERTLQIFKTEELHKLFKSKLPID